ncbi:unnamed protein product [Urochloa humidicola]
MGTRRPPYTGRRSSLRMPPLSPSSRGCDTPSMATSMPRRGILHLLDERLVPAIVDAVFHLKIKGDYHHYLDEFKTGAERNAAADSTLAAYRVAQVPLSPPRRVGGLSRPPQVGAAMPRASVACSSTSISGGGSGGRYILGDDDCLLKLTNS